MIKWAEQTIDTASGRLVRRLPVCKACGSVLFTAETALRICFDSQSKQGDTGVLAANAGHLGVDYDPSTGWMGMEGEIL